MDEYNVSMLSNSKDEWVSRIVSILTPLLIEGIKSIFNESCEVCKKTNEEDKYLMTFQNFISRIPKWNNTIIENEKKRIIEKSGCPYLEDLLTCVHIIQLKLLTAVRVGSKQKKIDINIIKLDEFIHKVYINIARKVYKNVYLFELNIQPLQIQKNNRELEIIIQECILVTIRDSIPIDTILKLYLDETIEEDVVEEVNEKIVNEKINVDIINKEILENKKKTEEQEKLKQLEKEKEEKEEKMKKQQQPDKITFDQNDKSNINDNDNVNNLNVNDDTLKIYDDAIDNNQLKLDIEDIIDTSTSNYELKTNDLLLNDIEILA